MSAGIAERLVVATLAERPELRGQAFSAGFAAAVPEFMRHDPTSSLYYGRGHLDHYLDFVLVAVDRDEPNRVVARGLMHPARNAVGRTSRNQKKPSFFGL